MTLNEIGYEGADWAYMSQNRANDLLLQTQWLTLEFHKYLI
jgi:hypothetical protein